MNAQSGNRWHARMKMQARDRASLTGGRGAPRLRCENEGLESIYQIDTIKV